MFFVLSKVLSFFVIPLNWVWMLLIWAALTRNERRRRQLAITTLTVFTFFSARVVVNPSMGWWEVETITADDIEEPYDVGILLGGYSNPQVATHDDRLNLSARGNRFFNAYELYRRGKVRKLLLSGGSGRLFSSGELEADHAAKTLRALGVPDSAIIIENRSRNTHENAVYTAELIRQLDPAPRSCLLITSGYHMRRAAGCFRKAGVVFTPFSVDYLYEQNTLRLRNFFPDSLSWHYWEVLFKEWIGYIAYWMAGYL